ncbi:MAG: hypothetical protein NTV87_12710 [Ignavibacteriae bacterium]|nr:hypothetical protein [Ignavibacteriota bacterium]
MRAISKLTSWSMRPALVLPFVPFGSLTLRLHCLSDAAKSSENPAERPPTGFSFAARQTAKNVRTAAEIQLRLR